MQVTVSYNARDSEHRRARGIGGLPGMVVRPRDEVDWDRPVLVVSRTGLIVRHGGQSLRWHPGLLHTRMEAGWRHPLCRITGLARGDRVVDCTLGLGTDAAFLARMTGRTVWASEAVVALALVTSEGLRGAGEDVAVVCTRALGFVAGMPDGAADVILGDPMFPAGEGTTRSLDVVRLLAEHEPLGPAWLTEARRVARKAVVMRDVRGGSLFDELVPDDVLDLGRRKPLYGVWFGADGRP